MSGRRIVLWTIKKICIVLVLRKTSHYFEGVQATTG